MLLKAEIELNAKYKYADAPKGEDIKATSVDNIDCTIRIEFAYLEKINEDKDDVSYAKSYQDVSFIDNPLILK